MADNDREGKEPLEPVEGEHGKNHEGAADEPRPADSSTAQHGGAPWGAGVHQFSEVWTRFEVRLCAVVVVAEILALCAWVVLSGLAAPAGADSPAGMIIRAALGATAFGLITYFAVRKRNKSLVAFATVAAILEGIVIAKAWDGVGSVYFSNLLNWLQDASSLTLIGGLRGLGTRLTVWLAMLGGSLAAASGKHIHIDVVRRFLPAKLRMPATVIAWTGAAAVCFTAAWGFTDHIAIGSYQVDRNAPAGEKLSAIGHHTGLGFFVLRKQLAFDVTTLTVVLSGKPYDSWLTNAEWNERITNAGWENHFPAEKIEALKMPPESANETRMPVVVVPGTAHTGMLKHLLNLVFPIGFIFIGLRMLLRALLLISGHVSDEEQEAKPKGIATANAVAEKGGEG